MSIKTIVVALALDDDSKNVASRAAQLAAQHGATLIGVHVIEDLTSDGSTMPLSINVGTLAARVIEQAIHELQSLLGPQHGSENLHVQTGKAHKVIADLAVAHHADVIVIGPGVAKGFREKIFGSTADNVIRYAACPVLVVRKPGITAYRHVAVGIDFSEHARMAAQWGPLLSPAATRELIHAFEIPLQFEQAMRKAGTSQAEIDNYRNAIANNARQKIIDTYGDSGQLPKSTRVSIMRGEPSSTLIDASKSRATDLVALGTQGTNAIAQHILGSVARQVLNNAQCDVLVVPARIN